MDDSSSGSSKQKQCILVWSRKKRSIEKRMLRGSSVIKLRMVTVRKVQPTSKSMLVTRDGIRREQQAAEEESSKARSADGILPPC